MNITQSL